MNISLKDGTHKVQTLTLPLTFSNPIISASKYTVIADLNKGLIRLAILNKELCTIIS